MPLLGIKGKAEYIAPTEIRKLEARDRIRILIMP